MKVMLTGAGGMLGSDLMAVLEHKPVAFSHAQLDISDPQAVAATVAMVKPQIIVNCAAFTKVDDCEAMKELAFAVNARGPEYLTAAAKMHDADILHVSTDYVFDGLANTPYAEDAHVNPLSIYGKSKLEGESCVRRYPRHYIVRTQWLYGSNGGNFVKTMLKLAAQKDELLVVDDQVGSPTYTKDLALAIAELISSGAYGTYHITNSGYTSWYGFTRDIFDIAGIKIHLAPCTTAQFPRPAIRPPFAPLENRNWLALGKSPLRGYRDALSEFLYYTKKGR